MAEHDRSNRTPLNPVITLDMLDKLKDAGFKTSPNKQQHKKNKPANTTGEDNPRQNSAANKYSKPAFRKPNHSPKKPVSQEAEIKNGVYTQPIDPFAT